MEDPRIEGYLKIITSKLFSSEIKRKVALEVQSHIEDLVDEALSQGKDNDEAISWALDQMGDPKLLVEPFANIYYPWYQGIVAILNGVIYLLVFTLLARCLSMTPVGSGPIESDYDLWVSTVFINKESQIDYTFYLGETTFTIERIIYSSNQKLYVIGQIHQEQDPYWLYGQLGDQVVNHQTYKYDDQIFMKKLSIDPFFYLEFEFPIQTTTLKIYVANQWTSYWVEIPLEEDIHA